MTNKPEFTHRPAQPYAAIRLAVTRDEIGRKAPPLIGEILGWIGQHGTQAGDAFFNYTMMDGERMDVEVGAPTETLLAGDGRVVTGTLPAGRYAELTHTGPYDGLRAAHEALHEWLVAQNVPPDGDGQSTLLEIYVTDPEEVPNPADWITRIAVHVPE